MVLILSDSSSDPKTMMMLRKMREKNAGYNSLSRLEDIIVTYKHEVDKGETKPAQTNTTSTKPYGWERNTRKN